MAEHIEEWAKSGLLNIVGGCCGTMPEHVRAIAQVVKRFSPREIPVTSPVMRLSGLEPTNIGGDFQRNFVNVGERTNVTGSARFKKLISEDDFDTALKIARQQVRNGAQIIDVNMDDGLLDSEAEWKVNGLLAVGERELSSTNGFEALDYQGATYHNNRALACRLLASKPSWWLETLLHLA